MGCCNISREQKFFAELFFKKATSCLHFPAWGDGGIRFAIPPYAGYAGYAGYVG
jgi:hypothetical protein